MSEAGNEARLVKATQRIPLYSRASFAGLESPEWDFTKLSEGASTAAVLDELDMQAMSGLIACTNIEPFGGAVPGTAQLVGAKFERIDDTSRWNAVFQWRRHEREPVIEWLSQGENRSSVTR